MGTYFGKLYMVLCLDLARKTENPYRKALKMRENVRICKRRKNTMVTKSGDYIINTFENVSNYKMKKPRVT